jgi:transposase
LFFNQITPSDSPSWHQHEDRMQAHILVCFLAFVLWKSLEMWQTRAGLGNSPRTILEELKPVQSQDVVLPTAAHGQIRLRCVTQPDPAQAALLNRLGIVLPKRMRLWVPPSCSGQPWRRRRDHHHRRRHGPEGIPVES